MSTTIPSAGKAAVTALAVACASLVLVNEAQAQSHGGRGPAHWGHGAGPGWHGGGGHYAPHYRDGYRRGGNGWVWGGVGLGLGLGVASYYNSYPSYYAAPGYFIVDPPVVYEAPRIVYSRPVPARTYSSVAQPVIYPRNGQSAAQTDADANTCSEWAGQQPNATSNGSVFQRATQACMDARGYTVR